jgi:pyruvate,water dikinase
VARAAQIVDFRHIGQGDIALVGSKGASLGELTQADLPVPPGFIITANGYRDFFETQGLTKAIKQSLTGIKPEDSKALQKVARAIQRQILSTLVPPNIREQIETAYRRLREHQGAGIAVAVRPSIATENVPDTNFAGQLETYLNVVGADAVTRAVHQCWASLFDAHAIYYRMMHNFDHFALDVAVVVQTMVHAAKAGVMFTANPLSGGKDEIVIEAAFGLGEVVVRGSITPDRYVVSKQDEKVLEMTVVAQPWQLVRVAGKNGARVRHQAIPRSEQRQQKLTFDEMLALAAVGKKIEDHYHYPQNVEWAIDETGKLWLLEAWPITTLAGKSQASNPKSQIKGDNLEKSIVATNAKVLVRGIAGSLGVASGPVKIIHKPSQIHEIKDGDILVTEQTSPSYLPAMQRAAALVTDTGGMTSHAVVMSRELGLPAVVGAGTATSHLKNGVVVTVDGRTGVVYQGKVAAEAATANSEQHIANRAEPPITATKVMLNLAEPKRAVELAKLHVDGVGLLRAEFMVAGMGVHPRYLLKEKKEHLYVRKLTEGIREIGQAFSPRPVIYRATDFKTNEYRALTGGDKVEPREENPMLGYRGAFRYLREPDLFLLEIQALQAVRESYGLSNIHLMIPFVRTVEEFIQVRGLIEQAGLLKDRSFQLWMMVEVPSNVLLLDQFLAHGVHGVSIGSNDLTQLILGVDRDNARLASAFDERNPAVMQAMEYVVKTCKKYHVAVSICGQAASVYPEVTEALIEAGITSVSVNPDVAEATRVLIASIERRLILDQLTRSAHGEKHPLWSVVPVSHR